jgi:hypothetical protein
LCQLKCECGARRNAAAHQLRIGDATGARPIKLGDQRAAWVGRNGRNRACTRPETKTTECKSCFCFGIKRHALILPARLATSFYTIQSADVESEAARLH